MRVLPLSLALPVEKWSGMGLVLVKPIVRGGIDHIPPSVDGYSTGISKLITKSIAKSVSFLQDFMPVSVKNFATLNEIITQNNCQCDDMNCGFCGNFYQQCQNVQSVKNCENCVVHGKELCREVVVENSSTDRHNITPESGKCQPLPTSSQSGTRVLTCAYSVLK